MQDISEESDKKLSLKSPSSRQEYLELINRLLELAYAKVQNRYCKNSERIAWIRAVTGLLRAASELLNDQQLQDLEARLVELEKQIKR